MLSSRPDPATVRDLLRRYVPVRLGVETSHLARADRLALAKLADAASWVDHIYWKQRSEDGWALRQSVSKGDDVETRELKRLLDLNFGPWDTLDGDRPFWGQRARPPGGNLYPADLTREELEAYILRHPEQRRALLSHTTLVRRHGKDLRAVPYEEAYRDELGHVARALVEASDLVTHDGCRGFLRARARGLVSGSLRESEELWIAASESPIDIAIGPYEVYDDSLMGVKTSYEATVLVRHPFTGTLGRLGTVTPELARRLPGAVDDVGTRRTVAIGIYDVACAGGMSNMGGKAMAATLPNDERVRAEIGARMLLYRNVIAEKFNAIVKPLGARVLRGESLHLVHPDAFLYHTVLHEMAHALSGGFVAGPPHARPKTINDSLKDRYSTIEECRADILGMVFLDVLAQQGLIPAALLEAAATTFVVSGVRSLRFGAADDYSRGAAIMLSHLLRTRAISLGDDGMLSVYANDVHRSLGKLAETVQDIATRGDYEMAGEIIRVLGPMPREISVLLPRLDGIPVDLELVFADLI